MNIHCVEFIIFGILSIIMSVICIVFFKITNTAGFGWLYGIVFMVQAVCLFAGAYDYQKHDKVEIIVADEYDCDGRNKDCRGVIEYENVNWFTSNIGLCDSCLDALYGSLTKTDINELYEACEKGNIAAIEKVCKSTV